MVVLALDAFSGGGELVRIAIICLAIAGVIVIAFSLLVLNNEIKKETEKRESEKRETEKQETEKYYTRRISHVKRLSEIRETIR